jgi:replicative DNA helicase
VLSKDYVTPNVVDFERIIIGSCIMIKGVVDIVSTKIDACDFYNTSHAEIYSAIIGLLEKNELINETTVKVKLDTANKPELVEVIWSCCETVCTIENIDYYIDKVLAKSKLRELITFGVGIGPMVAASNDDWNVVDKIDQKYNAVRFKKTDSSISSAKHMMQITVDDMHARHQKKVMGYKTGILELDNTIGELAKGDLVVIAGRPSMGKTALATSIALNQLKSGIKVGFLSLEMKEKAIGYRMVSVESGLNLFKIMHGLTSRSESPQLHAAISRISEYLFYIDDTPGLTWMRSKSIVRQMISRFGIQVVYLDHLHKMDYVDQNPTTGYEKITKGLSAAAKEMDIPIILLSQLKRLDKKKKDDRRPSLDDLRWSGGIEQDADTVILVHREEYYTKADEDKGKAELIVAKQRNGPTETVQCRFNAMCAHFENIAQEF